LSKTRVWRVTYESSRRAEFDNKLISHKGKTKQKQHTAPHGNPLHKKTAVWFCCQTFFQFFLARLLPPWRKPQRSKQDAEIEEVMDHQKKECYRWKKRGNGYDSDVPFGFSSLKKIKLKEKGGGELVRIFYKKRGVGWKVVCQPSLCAQQFSFRWCCRSLLLYHQKKAKFSREKTPLEFAQRRECSNIMPRHLVLYTG